MTTGAYHDRTVVESLHDDFMLFAEKEMAERKERAQQLKLPVLERELQN